MEVVPVGATSSVIENGELGAEGDTYLLSISHTIEY